MKTGIKDIDDLLKGGLTINEFTYVGSTEVDTKKYTTKEFIESLNTFINEYKAKYPNGSKEFVLDGMMKIGDRETIYNSDLIYTAAPLCSGEKVYHILKSRKTLHLVGQTLTEAEFKVFMSTYYGTQEEA